MKNQALSSLKINPFKYSETHRGFRVVCSACKNYAQLTFSEILKISDDSLTISSFENLLKTAGWNSHEGEDFCPYCYVKLKG